jgi:ribosomal protein S18 acetylase RimI-like enzyme
MLQFRRAIAQDVPLIHQLLTEMAEGALQASPESLHQHGFGAEPRFRLVLAEAEAPLGFCLFLPEYSSWRGEMGVFVQDIYLRPAARGLGAGRGLLAAAWAEAQDWQPGFMALMVKDSNHPAIGFYKSLGFALRDQASPYLLEGAALARL